MSRVGKKPVSIPDKVKVALAGKVLRAEGPKGKNELALPEGIAAVMDDKKKEIRLERSADTKLGRALHGTFRALAANLLQGVSSGYEKQLEIQGVGFRGAMKGDHLQLNVGFANTITVSSVPGVAIKCIDATHIVVSGVDKQKVGEVAAKIRAVRPPDVYQGKGVRYQGEFVRKKAGKASFSTTAQ